MRALAAPAIFVLIWSTGFIVARGALPYAETATLLAIRYVAASGLLALLALAMRAPWPRGARTWAHLLVVAMLMHVGYIGGVFASIERHMLAGVSALLVSLQPLLTAILAGPLLGEVVSLRQWIGLLLGLVGAGLVIWEKAGIGEATTVSVGLSAVALLGITLGTLYQKRFVSGMDLRSGMAVQYGYAALAYILGAVLFESMAVRWTAEFVGAMVWAVLALSIGANMLLFWLIRRGAASKVAALFYLVPPCTALIALPLFGETFGVVALIGMGVTVAGVALASRG
ncbi:MAG: DMT family transporter [Reyranellaceae bacterium]